MPMPEELRAGLDSPVADLRNITGDRWGGMLVAGAFLADFVPDGLPWVHLDIAGPAFNQGGAVRLHAQGRDGRRRAHRPRRARRPRRRLTRLVRRSAVNTPRPGRQLQVGLAGLFRAVQSRIRCG